MVNTIKFSEMTDGGDIDNNKKVPGLKSGGNVLFNNPWTFLPPGNTAQRPTPSVAVNYRLRFNTEEQLYEYYDAILGAWTQLQESLFTQGPFLIYTADASIPDGQNLGALSNGILKQTITTGVATLNIAVNGTDFYGPGYTGYINAPAGISDISGNTIFQFGYIPSAVNYLTINNAITGNNPGINALNSSDSNVGVLIEGKGTAGLIAASQTGDFPLVLVNLANGITANFSVANLLTTARNYALPDASGTFALTSQLPTPAALTEVNDTNVTLTLGGTPSTALLQAVSLTLGWTGTLSGTRGGTGVNNGSNTATFSGNLNFANSFTTSGNFAVTQTYTGVTNVTFPTSGTLATTSQLVTPAALTRTDDTNVTLTLGGSPLTALVNAASLTLGWTGQLAVGRGGIGLSSITAHNLLIGNGSSNPNLLAPSSTSGVPLISQGASADPIYGTAAIAGGGTGVTSVTTAPIASSWAGWDVNKNISANSLLEGYTTTPTAASTTVLTVGSTYYQFFTGSTTQTVTMPVASTLILGQTFFFVNTSSGAVTVQSSGGNTIQSMAANTSAIFTCVLTSGTTAASWNVIYYFNGGGSGTVSAGTANQMAYYSATGNTVTGLSSANNAVLTTSSGGVPAMTAVGTALAVASNVLKVSGSLLNIQSITATSTYTPTSGATNGIVFCVGGGGGGSGSGTGSQTSGGTGGTTSFGAICTAAGGVGGTTGSGFPGGTGGVGSSGTLNLTGNGGGGSADASAVLGQGGIGGGSFFGGGGAVSTQGLAGVAGATNSGGGGSGASGGASFVAGSGGGGGGCSIKFVSGLASTSCTIGAAGTAGGAGTSGFAGGAGGSGVILILEFA